jgi:trk system potassium uptake protein TrkA
VKGFSTVIPLGPDVGLIQFIVGKNSPVANRYLRDIHLPWGSTVVMIYRKGEVIIPRGDEVIKPGDTVTVVAKKTVESKVREIMVGK